MRRHRRIEVDVGEKRCERIGRSCMVSRDGRLGVLGAALPYAQGTIDQTFL